MIDPHEEQVGGMTRRSAAAADQARLARNAMTRTMATAERKDAVA
jgi:hypothetical protein